MGNRVLAWKSFTMSAVSFIIPCGSHSRSYWSAKMEKRPRTRATRAEQEPKVSRILRTERPVRFFVDNLGKFRHLLGE